jgi:hypothetical protein
LASFDEDKKQRLWWSSSVRCGDNWPLKVVVIVVSVKVVKVMLMLVFFSWKQRPRDLVGVFSQVYLHTKYQAKLARARFLQGVFLWLWAGTTQAHPLLAPTFFIQVEVGGFLIRVPLGFRVMF